MKIQLLLFLMVLSVPLLAQSGIRADKLQEDFDFLIQELRRKHQGLYQYEDKETVDKQIDSLRASIDAPMSRLAFYKLVLQTIGLTNEGHTSADLPKLARFRLGLSKSFLPLTLKHCDGNYVVTQHFGEEVEGLAKGAKLLAVNGRSMEEILPNLYPYIPTDGFNETSRREWMGSVTFASLYRLVYGKEKRFEVEILESGQTKSRTISLPAIRYTSFKTKNAKLPRKSIEHRRFVFRVIEDSIAYMSVPSFGRDGFDYPSFYRSSFRSMDSLGISHLILDLQANGGGTEGNENLLFSYLTDQRVQKYREVSMLPGPYEGNKTDEDFIFDKWQSKEGRAVRGEFTLYSDYLSDLGYEKPAVADIFHGKLYVLISGATFSGGAEMSSLVKMTERGLFIGEETGGAYEGNVSGYSEEVRLPHSRILVDIPTVHFQINVRPAVRGRGVMPDKVVARYWEDYSMNRNAKLEAALALIRQGGMMD